uniref:Capsular polysaccharide biosynthesis/export periplasmic protein WcbA Capsular polysaccharide export system protein KpsC n=1 Tax=Rheinheimera sp. BAL341 TaxID=1708203 RepID=A0A486XV97_9GAMM
MVNLIKRIAILLSFAFPLFVTAQSISPAMLEQFKKLPQSEQARLAKQYGIDPATLSAGKKSEAIDESTAEPLTPKHKETLEVENPNDKKAEADNQPKRFGVDLFNSEITTFAPTGFIPVPDSYQLGPDDQLQLQMFGKTNQQVELTVSREGDVFIPEIGNLSVAGLTFAEAKTLIQARVSQSILGVQSVVSMGQLRTINIFIAGEAKYPGSYTVSALTSVTQALFIAGGVSDIGSLRNINVMRNGNNVGRFDAYDLLLRGDAKHDIFVQNGDVIFIEPVQALAEVRGEVQRPALYEVSKADTVGSLLEMAGGAKSSGYLSTAVIETVNNDNLRELRNVNLTTSQNKALKVKDGDILRIGLSSPRVANQITLAGAVIRPGRFAWYDGIRVNNLVNSIWSDLYPTVDLDYALILRKINKQGDINILQFNLGNAISAPASSDNLSLQADDTVLVFHYGNMTANRERLNEKLQQGLKQQFDTPEFERWMSSSTLADDAFSLVDEVEQRRLVGSVAGYRVKDNVLAGARAKNASTAEPLSYAAMLEEQQAALQLQMQDYLKRLFSDDELLLISAQFTRQELLYTVNELLKQQARYGERPKIVSVSGETVLQGEFPLAENGNVATLIAAASGLKESAFINRAELTRISLGEEGDLAAVEHFNINLTEAFSNQTAAEFKLQSRDRLNVFAVPDWNTERLIEIRGEVRFPGRYSVQKGESLSSVLRRAGGLMEGAFVNGVIFTRQKVREREQLQMNKLIEQLTADVASRALSAEESMISPQESIAMIGQLRKAQPVGRLVIDMPGILANDPIADLTVEDGDVLYVPRLNAAITVVGEVQNTSSHRYRSDFSMEDYLALAGGYRKRADEDRVYIIRADGSVSLPKSNQWFAVNKSQLQPGDTIVVPLDTEYTNNMTLWTQVTQIFYQSAVALAAVASF